MVVVCEGDPVLPRIDSDQEHWFRLESSAPLVERNGGIQLGDGQHGFVG